MYRWFDYIILGCIILNSLSLAMFDYSDRGNSSKLNKALNYAGTAFTIIFLLEAIIKIIAMGFVLHKHAYLRDAWNIIDFIIVVTG
jgi:hypothetical protein